MGESHRFELQLTLRSARSLMGGKSHRQFELQIPLRSGRYLISQAHQYEMQLTLKSATSLMFKVINFIRNLL